MRSPYKRILVYDLETGGLTSKYNSITEIAIVAIDLEDLTIVDEFSVMFQPYLDLSNREEEPLKQAKLMFKHLATKDAHTNIKTLNYKGESITLKSLDTLVEDVKLFYKYLDENDDFISGMDLDSLLTSKFSDIANVFFNFCYHPQALRVTHISKELLYKEGIPYADAFNQIEAKIKEHTVKNSKPILAGHNIKRFDNSFMEVLFENNEKNLHRVINQTQMIDTLEWARIKWFEMPNYSLGTCVNGVGLTLKESHRALSDTIANAGFLIKMLENLRGQGVEEKEYKRKKFKFNF